MIKIRNNKNKKTALLPSSGTSTNNSKLKNSVEICKQNKRILALLKICKGLKGKGSYHGICAGVILFMSGGPSLLMIVTLST
jgi:hypothetical protein